jgi:hypothetical protein
VVTDARSRTLPDRHLLADKPLRLLRELYDQAVAARGSFGALGVTLVKAVPTFLSLISLSILLWSAPAFAQTDEQKIRRAVVALREAILKEQPKAGLAPD